MRLLSLLLLILLTASCQKDDTVTIGHQLMANPWKYLIASGKLNQLEGKKIEFKKFNSGAKVINAMASGSIDIAVAGSTPIAAGLSQGLPMKVIAMMEVIGDAEAMVVRNEINSLADLKGKKIGVPFGSTTHFHLMVALADAGISTKDVSILNLTPPSIVASWKKGEIDAAFVWAPALEDIKATGKVLISSKDIAAKGKPTFDGIIARDAFIKENGAFLKAFLKEINTLHKDYNSSPWTLENEKVQTIAKFTGSDAKNVVTALAGYTFPEAANQKLESLGQTLKDTAVFLKQQGKIEQVLNDYGQKVETSLIQGL